MITVPILIISDISSLHLTLALIPSEANPIRQMLDKMVGDGNNAKFNADKGNAKFNADKRIAMKIHAST